MKTVRALVPALLIAASAPVFAYEAGDLIVRGGVAYVDPDSSAAADSALGLKNLVSVESSAGVTITGTYMFHKNFGVEVVGALPFQHDINGDGALKGVGKVAETKHLPPTVLVQFYPLESNTFVQPYVGLGVNYTKFFENDTTDEFTSTLNGVINTSYTDTSIDLDDSTGVGAEVGADWILNKNLSINTSVWYLDIETTAHINGGGAEVTKFDVTIDPLVYAVGLAYKF